MYSSVLAWKSQAKVVINIVAPAAVKKVLPVGGGGDIPPSPTQFRAIQSHRTISSKTSWINLRCSIGRTAANSSKMSCRPPIRTNKLRGQTRQGWREARGQGIRGPCQAQDFLGNFLGTAEDKTSVQTTRFLKRVQRGTYHH